MSLATTRKVDTRPEALTPGVNAMNIIPLENIEPIRILALDQDTQHVGWAKGIGPDYQDSGTQDFNGPTVNRLHDIYTWLKAVLIEFRPALLVLEKPMADHGNRNTDRILGQLLGICQAAGWETYTPFMVIGPHFIRSTGYHKEATRDAAYYAGKPKVDGHEADAIGALVAGWIRYRNAKLGEQVATWTPKPKKTT